MFVVTQIIPKLTPGLAGPWLRSLSLEHQHRSGSSSVLSSPIGTEVDLQSSRASLESQQAYMYSPNAFTHHNPGSLLCEALRTKYMGAETVPDCSSWG